LMVWRFKDAGKGKVSFVVRLLQSLQSPSLELRYEWQWVVTIDCLHVRIHVVKQCETYRSVSGMKIMVVVFWLLEVV
jgi:hypothetical protein